MQKSLISLLIIAIIMCIYTVFRSIDNRLIAYLLVFTAGIVACRTGIFEDGKIDKYIPALIVCLLSAFATEVLFFNGGIVSVHTLSVMNIINFSLSLIAKNILMISLPLILFWMVRKFGTLNLSKKLFLPQISHGSYAAYLFDSVCFASILAIATSFGVKGNLLNIIIFIIAFPMVFIVGNYAQKLEFWARNVLINLIHLGPRESGV